MGQDKPIRNPYYQAPAWKLWDVDPSPSSPSSSLRRGRWARSRHFPRRPGSTRRRARHQSAHHRRRHAGAPFLAFRKGDWPQRKYAGFWDDVYLSVDNNGTNPPTPHSWMPNTLSWEPKFGPYKFPSLNDQPMAIYGTFGATKEFGVNFTSQSTTGMGHDIANNGSALQFIEREMYSPTVYAAARPPTARTARPTTSSCRTCTRRWPRASSTRAGSPAARCGRWAR